MLSFGNSLWVALGVVATLPVLAAAQSSGSHSVIKPVGHTYFGRGGCSSCATPAPTCAAPSCAAPTCCTAMPGPSVGRCCPRPCLLDSFRRSLRSLNCLLPCSLSHRSTCGLGCGSSCNSCTASCPSTSSCASCCTKTRAHFFAFCKPRCGSSCNVGCSDSIPMTHGVPMNHGDMMIPQPMPDNNPFMDDKPLDPNAPPATRQETYKPYFKKNGNTVAAPPAPTPARRPEPAKLDPYAKTEPVYIKARPVTAAPRIARTESFESVAPVSLTISDDAPPSPPMLLPAQAPPRRLENSLPSNPLR